VETDRDAILKRFDELGVWRRGDQRAPHKPLLVLYALGRWRRGQADVSFREAEPELKALLRDFGPPRRSDHSEQPYWRLQRDGVWTVHASAGLAVKKGDEIHRVTALHSHDVRAEFPSDVRVALTADPGLVAAIASLILERTFSRRRQGARFAAFLSRPSTCDSPGLLRFCADFDEMTGADSVLLAEGRVGRSDRSALRQIEGNRLCLSAHLSSRVKVPERQAESERSAGIRPATLTPAKVVGTT
jgi:hypothetical protein